MCFIMLSFGLLGIAARQRQILIAHYAHTSAEARRGVPYSPAAASRIL